MRAGAGEDPTMNETLTAVAETLRSILAQHCEAKAIRAADAGEWSDALWRALDEAGVPLTTVPEEQGGLGLGLGEAAFIARVLASYAAPVPLAETMLAHWLWHAAAGSDVQPGVTAGERITLHVAPAMTEDGPLSGELARVAWARHADTLLLAVPRGEACDLVRIKLADEARVRLVNAANLADEPRDTVTLTNVEVAAHNRRRLAFPLARVFALQALMRSAQLVGAMEAAVGLTVQYANERVQFGRPLGKFQAIQHHIAGMAEQLAAATVAVEQAAASAHDPARVPLLWMAKALASESAGKIAAASHQVHGAIGFTREYRLQPLTRRLWSWREEAGNEAYWFEKVGALTLGHGADALWPWLIALSPSADAGPRPEA